MIMLVTDKRFGRMCGRFPSGVATSGFWDGSLYPAIAEANPKYSASTTIGIKLVISISGIVYPLFVAMNSGANWHINIMIPIVMSVIATVMAICTPFIYDDERKIAASSNEEGAKNKAQEEIQAAKDAMLEQPNAMVNACTLFFGFLIMFIMYGAQQYTKQFGITNLGLDATTAAGLTSIYTVGSVVAVLFWAWMMGKFRWTPIKVILIDFILAACALALLSSLCLSTLVQAFVYVHTLLYSVSPLLAACFRRALRFAR